MTIPTGSTAITDPTDPTHQATVDSSGALKVAATFSAASVAIQDGTNASQKLAVDSNGKIGISSIPSVTANIGTSGSLALETGGNLATLAGAVTSSKVQANVSQINGATPLMGNGASGTGVQRVTIANDSTGQIALAAGAATIGSLAANQSTNVNQWAGATPSVSNPVYVSQSAQSGYVAAWGTNPAALTANTDALFKWGGSGTTVVNHLMIQNNTALNVLWDVDVATSAGSPVLGPNQTIFLDVQTTALHVQANGTPAINGTSGSNIVVRAWL